MRRDIRDLRSSTRCQTVNKLRYRHLGRDIGYELFGPVAGMATIHAAAEDLRLAQLG